jgi:hypothetical protein
MRTGRVGGTQSKRGTPQSGRSRDGARRADATASPDRALVGLLGTMPLLAGIPRNAVVRIASQMR